MKGTHFVLITLLFLFSCQKNELPDPGQYDAELEALLIRQGGVDRFRIPDSDDFDKIPQDPLNPITSAKVQLGQKLFHETMIAVNPRMPVSMGTYSCASCHHQAAGFQAGIKQGIGEGGTGFGVAGEGRLPAANFPFDSLDVQPIRSPSVLNTAFQEVMLWNGQFGATGLNEGTRYAWKEGTPIATNQLGYEGLEIQAIAGMGVHRLDIKQPDFTGNDYAALFAEAFPNMSLEEMYSKEAAGLAIAAYERTVLANEAPFQSWLKGEKAAMNDQEKRGALLFFGDAGCVNCHNTAGLSGRSFAALGMGDLDGPGTYGTGNQAAQNAKLGRGGFTGRGRDNYRFKVPQLYNLKDVAFLGHGGTFGSIESVVRYKNIAISENLDVPEEALDIRFQPLRLNEAEVQDLISFLENALYDPALDRYVPESLPSGKCFPNADDASRGDLGCN